MQLTLVSHYGPKSFAFADIIGELQQAVGDLLNGNFRPYAVEQVHATIVGLEGSRIGGGIRNENHHRYRGEERCIRFHALLHFLRNDFRPFEVRIGGFADGDDHGFTSQGASPYVRSFSIQDRIAVAMGWPFEGSRATPLLDGLRRQFQTFGVLHKWHRRRDDADNDFFFVLGRVDAPITLEQCLFAERHLREKLSQMSFRTIAVNHESLAFVGYSDTQLPLANSRVFELTDPNVTPELLESVYD